MIPVYVDVEVDTLNLDLDEFEKLLNDNDRNIKCAMIVHTLGNPVDMNRVNRIIGNKDILVIEDCCEALGAHISNSKVGTFGDGGTFSFYWGHHMTSIEGGMIITSDKDLFHIMRLKRSHGMARELPENEWESVRQSNKDNDFRFLFLTLGYNFRSSEINAFIGNLQLKEVDEIIKKRNNNYIKYLELLSKYDFIKKIYKDGMSSFSLPLIFDSEKQKNIAQNLLDKSKIESRPLISGNLLRHPAFSKFKGDIDYKNSDMLHERALYIGNHQFLLEKNFVILDNVLAKVNALS